MNAGLHSCERGEPGAVNDRVIQKVLECRHRGWLHHDRHKDVRRHANLYAEKFRRRNSDDGEGRSGNRNALAEYRWGKAEPAFPVAITDHRDGMTVGDPVVFDADASANYWSYPEERKVTTGDQLPIQRGLEAALYAYVQP